MPRALALRNRQKNRAVDSRLFRRVITALLDEVIQLQQAELGVLVVGTREITQLNGTFLRRAGSTDVIAFDYTEGRTRNAKRGATLCGEIFICLDEAVAQARRYRTSWQMELVRYAVHGVLHLLGFDDRTAAARRRMKREEDRLLRALARRFALSRLGCSR